MVHRGETFIHSVLVDNEVKRAIEKALLMAPLNNPANLADIAGAIISGLLQMTIFFTGFF